MKDIINLGTRVTHDGVSHNVALKTNALCTHAVVVGASGSGKSGAIIGMVEEMVRIGIPTFLIDVKGDIANIALQPEHVRDRMALRFLTPGGTHGEAVNIFSGIENPDRITSTVSTIFKLVNSKAEITSTQHAFLSNIIQWRLKAQKPCTIVDILNDVVDPPFDYLGVLPLEDVFPAASRGKLASKLNNLLAAPSFQAWREGVAIDINKLLSCAPNKVPVVVYSVAHLVDDVERIFAVSMFLEEMLSWMRKQPGTKELKACLILDEMYGVMPPHPYNPPTKKPLLTMVKQGRAHGLGIVLCSQNPMDLDYKGMSNAQTWFVGRLQTANDRARVVNGICASTAQDSRVIETSIARLQPRQFLLVRPSGTAIFTTRDCSAELRGPMNPMEIKKLFTSGIAEEVMSRQLLELQLENARSVFEHTASDTNWAAVELAQKKLDSHGQSK